MTILVQDSFNRADDATTIGSSWSNATLFGISNNQAYRLIESATYDGTYQTVNTQTYTTQIKVVNFNTNNTFTYLFCRYTNSSNFVGLRATNRTSYTIEKRIAGTFTTLATLSQIPVDGDVLKIEHTPDGTIKAYINNVLGATVTDTSLMGTSNNVGFGGRNINVVRFDDFVTDDGSSSGIIRTLSLSDSITLGESFVKQRQGYLFLVDNLTLSESFTKRRQSYLSLADGLTIGDTETSTRATINTLVRALSDSINMTDSITIRVMRYLTIFDLFSIVDSIGTTGGGNVAQTIKFKRGNEVDLPTLAEGEPAVTLDTNKMFVGTPNGNQQIATLLVVDSVDHLPVADKSKQFLISGVLGGTGTADALYVCKKLSNDTYDWVQFV
jgi:hypothetical protein